MNDAERDAWLREALRHAPDAEAVPPTGVSEAILAKARAQARAGAPPRRVSRNAFAAFWDWLARPPVAASFASVMAATLVGVMWWDRPMDETLGRAPLASERDDVARQRTPVAPAAPTTIAAPPAPRTEDAAAATTAQSKASTKAAADDSDLQRGRLDALKEAPAADAKLAEAGPPEKRKVDPLAKERPLAAEAKNEAPAPFPSPQSERERPAEAARKSLQAPAADAAKKADDTGRSRATDAIESAAAPPAAPSITPPQAPTMATRPPTAAVAPAPTTAPAPTIAPAPTVAPAPAAAPTREPAPFSEFARRQRAQGELREKDAGGMAAPAQTPGAAPLRDEAQEAGRPKTQQANATRPAGAATNTDAPTSATGRPRADVVPPAVPPAETSPRAAAAAPLARVIAAIAADPERWSRRTAAGDTVALDAGWRAWLAEVDAAAAGRWRPLGSAGPAAADVADRRDGATGRDTATTLRLVNEGRLAAVIRIDGSLVQVDAAPGTGERWQAALSPAPAERLRTTSRALSP